MAAMRRRRTFATFGAMALAVSGNPSCAFVISHSRYNAFLSAPRGPLAVRQLHMATGSPRGRSSGGGVGIEGADGTIAVLTSSTTSPIQSLQSIDEYAEDERVAEGGASLGAEQGMEDFRDFTGQGGVIENSREATLGRKNSFLKSAIIAAAIGAGAWVAATNFLKRQSDLVNAYGDEMTYYVGDEREMELCHKEYKGKLGPAMYRDNMYKEVIRAIGTKRAMTLDTVRSVKQIIKLFKFSTTKAVKLLVVAARSTERSQTNVRSKLYFLGTLIAKGNNKAGRILEPLRKNIESSFLADGEDMLMIRINNMAEGALKAAIEAVPDDQVLESGWEELGISDDRAAEIASALADEEGAPGGIDFYKTGGPGTNDVESDPEAAQMLKQLETDMEAKKEEPQDEKDPEPEGTPKAYECQVCGYKMFVAKGREFKFFGDDFKCPECGAGKNKFTEADVDDDLI